MLCRVAASMRTGVRMFSDMADRFAAAQQKLNTLTEDPGNNAKLKLYGLFKQVLLRPSYSSLYELYLSSDLLSTPPLFIKYYSVFNSTPPLFLKYYSVFNSTPPLFIKYHSALKLALN